MTDEEKSIYKAYKFLGSLCWECRNALCGCNWSKNYEEVEGWVAIRRDVLVTEGNYTKSYFVIDCPEFLPDEVR